MEVNEECESEVVEAPFEVGAVCPVVAPDEEILGVSATTGILEDPAGAADAAAPSHIKATALTPSDPSK